LLAAVVIHSEGMTATVFQSEQSECVFLRRAFYIALLKLSLYNDVRPRLLGNVQRQLAEVKREFRDFCVRRDTDGVTCGLVPTNSNEKTQSPLQLGL
jgi:hypothetical protein